VSPIAPVARRLGWTEGQAYTAAIGLVLAVWLAATGLPAVLSAHPAVLAAAPAVPAPLLSAPSTTIPQATATATATGTLATGTPAPAPGPSVAGRLAPGVVAAPPALTVANGPAPPPFVPAPTILASPATAAAPGTISLFTRVGPPGAPGGLAVGADGTVYVTTDNGTSRGDPGPSRIFAFQPDGSGAGSRAVTGQSSGHADGLTGAAVNPVTGDVTVLDPDTARVLGIDMVTGAQTVVATIPDLPACLVSLAASPCEPGLDDHKPAPAFAAYDSSGDLFVTDPAQDTIWRVGAGDKTAAVWYQSDDFTTGDGPDGLVVSPTAVAFTVGTTLDPSAPDGGALYRVAIGAGGVAGVRTLVRSFGRDSEPGALAVGSSRTAYVVLRHTGSIMSIAPSGSTIKTITPPGGGPVPLVLPAAVAIIPGALLVANQGSTASQWAVLAIAEQDGSPS